MERLTPPQHKALSFIHDEITSRGTPPTLRELCEHMLFGSLGSAQDVVAALRKKGFLENTDRQSARSLVLTPKAQLFLGELVDEDDLEDDVWTLPCLGSVPAGNPIEAVEARIGLMSFSSSLLPRPRPKRESLYALKAKGDSMIGAGILSGDWLVVQGRSEAAVGMIVVAKVEQEITVKRFMEDRKNGPFLMPENPAFAPIYGHDMPFSIVGRVVALQRQL